MLVLSRKKNEGIVFDGPGRVVVVEIHGSAVRLGFIADKSVAVHRDEVAARATNAIRRGEKSQMEDQLDFEENQNRGQ